MLLTKNTSLSCYTVIHFKPGKEIHVADYLRFSSHNLQCDCEVPRPKVPINGVAVDFNTNLTSLLQIKDDPKQIDTLPTLCRIIQNGQSITQSMQKHYCLAGITWDNFRL